MANDKQKPLVLSRDAADALKRAWAESEAEARARSLAFARTALKYFDPLAGVPEKPSDEI